jgi:hypothetical protein
VRKSSANGTKGQTDWNAINWRQVNRRVRNLRQRIFRASRGLLLGLLGKWQYFPRPQSLSSVTLKKNRNAEMAMWIEPGISFFSLAR